MRAARSKRKAVETAALWNEVEKRTSTFSHLVPQGLENSPPKTLRVSHSSHSFDCWSYKYFSKAVSIVPK
jgi:hypothetical protein